MSAPAHQAAGIDRRRLDRLRAAEDAAFAHAPQDIDRYLAVAGEFLDALQ